MEEKENAKLSLSWWHFWEWFRLPVGLFLSICVLAQYAMVFEQLSIYGIIEFIIRVALTIFMGVTLYFLISRKKYGFEIIIIYCIFEVVFSAFSNIFGSGEANAINLEEKITIAAIVSIIYGLIWVYPNYLYFKKRKHLFGENERKEREKTSEVINDLQENNTDTVIKEYNEENKKYCTKCGNQVEDQWTFCKNCGNKLE